MPTIGGKVRLLEFPENEKFVIDTPEGRLAVVYLDLAGEVVVLGSAYGINNPTETIRNYKPMLGNLTENTMVTKYEYPDYPTAKPANIK